MEKRDETKIVQDINSAKTISTSEKKTKEKQKKYIYKLYPCYALRMFYKITIFFVTITIFFVTITIFFVTITIFFITCEKKYFLSLLQCLL